jgi:hypothetical protein
LEGDQYAIATYGEQSGFDLLWHPQLAEVAIAGEIGWTGVSRNFQGAVIDGHVVSWFGNDE